MEPKAPFLLELDQTTALTNTRSTPVFLLGFDSVTGRTKKSITKMKTLLPAQKPNFKAFPPWFDPRNREAPGMNVPTWLELKIDKADRDRLVNAEQEFDDLLSQQSKDYPDNVGRKEWERVRQEYSRTANAELLKRLDEVGYKGVTLAAQTRERNQFIWERAGRIATEKDCAPIYSKVFEQAAGQMLEHIGKLEGTERLAAAGNKYAPSDWLRRLTSLAAWFAAQAHHYHNNENRVQEPRSALSTLWPLVANSERK